MIEFLNKDESQNEFQNKVLKGSVNVELSIENVPYKESILNGMDPVLKDELIPVTIEDDGIVHQAHLGEEWYSYEEKEWANAVILKDESEMYCPGEIIPESNIESYFVWIPKYRYRLWDLGKYDGLTSIDESKVHTIPLVFGDYNTKDEIDGECTTPMESGESGACQVGNYMTHPAFLSIPSTGFWVGKFETSKSNNESDNSTNPEGIQIKPNVMSWQNIQVGNAFYTSFNYKRNLDSHMMKNTEWGAVTYLSHSEYGANQKVRTNNNSLYLTGYASVTAPTCGYTGDNQGCNQYGALDSITKPYNTEVGYLASTTANISGIYDMSGGIHEYVMGTMVNPSDFPFMIQNDKMYYDLYQSGNSSTFNRRILGDATGELGPFTNNEQFSSWYLERAVFITTSLPWFIRGGHYTHGQSNGIFYFHRYSGNSDSATFRIILTPTH